MGDGSADPQPTWCITVDGSVVGWVDHEVRDDILRPGERNVGWAVHPDHRGRGYATRAVRLMVSDMDASMAVAIIEPDNEWSRAVATRAGFVDRGVHDMLGKRNHRYERVPPPRTYTDGVVTIRPQRVEDAEASIEATDDVQIDWLWLPGQRGSWEAMSAAEKLAHQRAHHAREAAAFGSGPKWSFTIERSDGAYVGHVDADLANDHVPAGEANISYSCTPALRGNGYVSRAVRLCLHFVTEHTGAREAHIVVDPGNEASLRVQRAVGGPVIPLRGAAPPTRS